MTDTHSEIHPKFSPNELIKFVFDNIRNVIICISIMTAASAVFRFRNDLPASPACNELIAYALALIGFGLLMWNLIHGATTIAQQYKMRRLQRVFLMLPLAGIYMYLMWMIVLVMLRIR